MRICSSICCNADGKFYPVSRELVFDIDLTDYDDVRTCGSGGHICNSCWPLMAVAIQVRRLSSMAVAPACRCCLVDGGCTTDSQPAVLRAL